MKTHTLITFFFLAISLNATTLDNVIDILGYVESSNNHHNYQVGDNCKAIGYLQLHKIFVDDANRILKCKKFKYSDRLDRNKSIAIAKTVIEHYKRTYERQRGKRCTIYQLGYILHLGGSWRRDTAFNKRHKISYMRKMKQSMITRTKERR